MLLANGSKTFVVLNKYNFIGQLRSHGGNNEGVFSAIYIFILLTEGKINKKVSDLNDCQHFPKLILLLNFVWI